MRGKDSVIGFLDRIIPIMRVSLLCLFVAISAAALAQDPVTTSPQFYKVLLENDQVRVLEYRLKPGEKEPMHSHSTGVVYVMNGGTLKFSYPDGRVEEKMATTGETLWRDSITHTVENTGKTEARAIAVDLKSSHPQSKGTGEDSKSASAEQRLKDLGIKLPEPPKPFGSYVESVQTGNLLFLSGMLPTEGHGATFVGRVGAELDLETGRKAAHLAALNALAVARQHLGSLDKVTRVVRLGVSIATSGDVRDQPKIADGASELFQSIFGKDKNPCRTVYGVASLPLGTPVELEVILEVAR